MQQLFLTFLFLASATVHIGAQHDSTLPHCTIAVFECDSSWTISCPSGTPYEVVATVSDSVNDGKPDSVTIDITRGNAFTPPTCVRWTLLDLSQDGCRVCPSPNVDWSKLGNVIGRLRQLGYKTTFSVSHINDVVTIGDDDAWVWNALSIEDKAANKAVNRTAAYSHFNGDWEVARDMHKALGYKSRDAAMTFPSSFSLSLDAKLEKDADPAKVTEALLQKIGHKLHTSGHWVADAEEMGFKTDRCVVSIHDGRTFLWFTDVPFIAHYGGSVSYIEGADKSHDLLAIDFNTMPKHSAGQERGSETIVYRRKHH